MNIRNIHIQKWPLIISAVQVIISFFTDRHIFTAAPFSMPQNYIPCKILMFVLLLVFWSFIFSKPISILKYAGFYLVPIIAVMIFKLPQGFLSNDERLIFEQAVQLADYTWFYYITTWYYIISLMIIPAWFGPIIIKVILQVLICGYCVSRLTKYLDKKYGRFLYLAFLLPPVLAYTTSAHRIPVYYLIYLFLLYMLLMDRLEHVKPSPLKLSGILLLIAVLTQWRTEGIYFAVIGVILMFLAYPSLHADKKTILRVCAASLIIQYIVAIPQYGVIPTRMNDKAENRMAPFYAYTITNMFRNGLDLDKNAADLKEIDRYISIDTIKAINDYLGDTNYEDALILYYPGYTGKRPDATDDDYRAYVAASKRIFINNPGVLLRTKIGSFDYAATVYDIKWSDGGLKGFALFLVSIVKTIAYNLYLPMLLLFLLWIYTIIKRRPWTFFMTSGLLAHWFIVFVLAPASYFKYYFPVYFTTYFWVILVVIAVLWNKRHQETRRIIC